MGRKKKKGLKAIRHVGGKRFVYSSTHRTKRPAQRKAIRLRKTGHLVRIPKHKGKYEVWVHRK